MNAVVQAAPPAAPTVVVPPGGVITPVNLLALAYERNASIEQLERLMALKREWEADEARKAYNAAFAAFKADAVQIVKSKKITDGPLKGKYHADLWDVVMAATEPLAKHGLSTSWAITKDEPTWIEVTCTLRHAQGHSESIALGGEPDTGPGRNKIQARASTITYLERYTLTAILGLAAREADDDGKGGARDHGENAELAQELQRLVAEGRKTASDETALAFWNAHKGKFYGHTKFYDEFKAEMAAHRVELKEAGK